VRLAGERRVRISEELLFELPETPESLTSRLRGRLNQRPKRVLGILKVSDEWIGVVHGNEFAVWERRQHAMRAQGRIRGVRGGSRVEARIALTRRSAAMMVIFFVLFAIGAVGILSRPEGLGLSPATLVLAALAGFGTLLVFWIGSLRQRAALRAFLADVFRPAP
jgi:hypothetical protein